MELVVAGHLVTDPMGVWVNYSRHYGKTLERYDLADPGDPDLLTRDEAWRSRIIASRLTHQEADAVVERAESAPWTDVPQDVR